MTHSPHRPRSKPTSWAAKFAEMQREEMGAPEEGFYTTIEWAKRIKRSAPQASRLLRLAVKDGEVEMRMYRIAINYITRPIPHYRLVTPARSIRSSSGKAS